MQRGIGAVGGSVQQHRRIGTLGGGGDADLVVVADRHQRISDAKCGLDLRRDGGRRGGSVGCAGVQAGRKAHGHRHAGVGRGGGAAADNVFGKADLLIAGGGGKAKSHRGVITAGRADVDGRGSAVGGGGSQRQDAARSPSRSHFAGEG